MSSHAQPGAQSRASRLVDRSLCDGALCSHAGHYAVQVRLDDDAAYDHLAQGRVEGLEVEDQIELADVLEQLVQRLDVHLDQVEQG